MSLLEVAGAIFGVAAFFFVLLALFGMVDRQPRGRREPAWPEHVTQASGGSSVPGDGVPAVSGPSIRDR
jgi:hypothetical protein